MNDENPINNSQSYYYPGEQEPGYGIGYNTYPTQMQHPAARVQIPDMHPSYHPLGLNPYPAGVFSTSPPHGSLPLANSPPPPSPEMYDPISPPLSGSDTSADGIYHHSNSSGANSPSSSRGHSLVHRSHRYNPTPSPTSSSSRRRSRSHDSDDDDDVMGIAADQNLAYSRKEATRRQRIEAEQRRRDELREGYAKLKDALPVSNQKSSKVSLLERATNYIILLEQEKKELIDKLVAVEEEAKRLRVLNEKISLSTEGTPSPDHAMGRMTSPTPDTTHTPSHSLASVRGQQPPSEHSSPSASEGGH
ncbi:hypothetical protein HYPSUDRAFT_62104 [Hypholoma sublateritium FD-334 SS-4]|uniref:BHLH domain-containing protein n=1 Tax=Hypholoma sublateritium (strain FD-334 SS-4) TaxID=945553 RepID=A0A0D2LKW8_HYPSF|nr:hypothetical protein HYPSUDRAFT_62104 [Hypholoma sublateritium FD-334 SS-4]